MKREGKIHIGTSGWHYKHWKGRFYPEDIKPQAQLAYYAKLFTTVELNNSFYRLPTDDMFRNWASTVSPGFLFAVKGSRYFTHMKKLKLTKEDLKAFFYSIDGLGNKLGPILFQLPPGWKLNLERLGHFLSILPKHYKYVFEFRNPTWYTTDVYSLLKKYNCSLCWYHLAGYTSPEEITARFVYIRLHGPGDKYQGSYTTQTLKKWAKKCDVLAKQGKTVYIYFDNDEAGYAAFNALKLAELINQH